MNDDRVYFNGIWMVVTSDGHRFISKKTYELCQSIAALWEKDRVMRLRAELIMQKTQMELDDATDLIEELELRVQRADELRAEDLAEFMAWKKYDDDQDRKRKRNTIIGVTGGVLVIIIETVLLILTNLPSGL